MNNDPKPTPNVKCKHCALPIHFDQGETRHLGSGSIFCKKKRGMTLMEAEPKIDPKPIPDAPTEKPMSDWESYHEFCHRQEERRAASIAPDAPTENKERDNS